VANRKLSHITSDEEESLIQSRDCQEIPFVQGRAAMKIFSAESAASGSLLDDFQRFDEAEAKLAASRVVAPDGKGGRQRVMDAARGPGVRSLDRRAID
jgi:hypothetical protein